MHKHLILENKIGAVIFGLLALGSFCGICAGNWIHCFTLGSCSLVSWALLHEARQMEQE